MLSIRPATVDDVPLLRTMICELADFEHQLHCVSITEAELVRDGFGEHPIFRALIAEWDGQAAGYGLYFDFYSTWRGRQLFLEDLFVRPQFRGKGVGKGLLEKVAGIAQQSGCCGMRWEVLDWNHPAIEFYRGIGAEILEDLKLLLFTGEAFKKMAGDGKSS